jgi:hypothetical protein
MNRERCRQRRGKRDPTVSATQQIGRANGDPDHDLSHFHCSSALHNRPRRDIDGHLHAFASIDAAKHIEKSQNAGVSSAAACITLELPMMKSISTRGAGHAGELALFSDDNRKRRSLVSTKEVQQWRNSNDRAYCRFKPVFTHQFFTDEKILGYRPTDGAIEEAGLLSLRGSSHPSFSQHSIAGHTLLIQVKLAPSCRKCCMIVEIGRAVRLSNENATPYQPELATKTKLTRVGHFQRRVVSWDGDDESRDGKVEDFEFQDKLGGRKRRVRPHHSPVRQARSRRNRGDSFEHKEVEDYDDKDRELKFYRGMSRQRMSRSKSNCAMRSRRLRYDNESGRSEFDSEQAQSINSSPRQVTDVSDGPSSDEEVESCHSGNMSCSESSNNLAKMKVGTIITQVSGGLPDVAAVFLKDSSVADKNIGFKIMSSNVRSTADIENDYLDQPIGDVVREYSREKRIMSHSVSGIFAGSSYTRGSLRKPSTGNFVLSLADMRFDKEACKYHDEVEKLSQWFIEIASPVHIGSHGGTDADGGFWRVLYLFEKHSQGGASKYSLAGYMTLFYRSLQMIVCQVLCLPPYQRSGHGTEMLRAAYEACDGREIQVESPAPAFGEELLIVLL